MRIGFRLLTLCITTFYIGIGFAHPPQLPKPDPNNLPWYYTQYPEAYHNNFWFNVAAGLGVGDGNNASGWAGELSANLRFKRHWLLTLRSSGVADNSGKVSKGIFCGMTGNLSCSEQNGSIGDIGGLLGYIFYGEFGYTSAALGISMVTLNQPLSNGTLQSTRTVGFPVETQSFWTPTGYLGLGLIVFADANTRRSYAGAAISLQIGDFHSYAHYSQ